MIVSFKHRGLKAFYDGRTSRRIAAEHAGKLKNILTVLDRSRTPQDMNLPGFRLHPLKGNLKGYYAVTVSGNWRLIFRFENSHAADVDYIDYH